MLAMHPWPARTQSAKGWRHLAAEEEVGVTRACCHGRCSCGSHVVAANSSGETGDAWMAQRPERGRRNSLPLSESMQRAATMVQRQGQRDELGEDLDQGRPSSFQSPPAAEEAT